ncbi:hypothetical protein IAT40_000328 [Kwoniella sp. CBS 6097]
MSMSMSISRTASLATRSSRPLCRACRRSPVRVIVIRRAFTETARGKGDEVDPSISLREVMRNVPQPVAIAVTSVPASSPLSGKAKYHGATLTSFTSLTLYPHPLVAFSLRLPSRMADCLRPWRTHSDHQPKPSPTPGPRPRPIPSPDPTSGFDNDINERIPIPNSGVNVSNTNTEEALRRTFGPKPKRTTGLSNITGQPSSSSSDGGGGIVLPPKSDLPWPLSKLPMPEQPPEWAKSLFAQIPNPLASSSSTTSTSLPISTTPLQSSLTSSSPSPVAPQKPNTSLSANTTSPIPATSLIPPHPTPLTISLLSTSNESIADSLSLPRTDHSSIFNLPDTWLEHTTHPPSLINAVGALQCEVVGSVLLRDLCGSALDDIVSVGQQRQAGAAQAQGGMSLKQGEGSELFICRVVGVEMPSEAAVEAEVETDGLGRRKPLLHWRRKYVSIDPHEGIDLEKA